MIRIFSLNLLFTSGQVGPRWLVERKQANIRMGQGGVYHMEQYILVVDFDNNDFEVARREWNQHNVLLHVVHTIPDAIKELIERNYIFIAILSKRNDFFPQLQILRDIRPVSTIIFSPDHDVPNRTIEFFMDIDIYLETAPGADLFLDRGKRFLGYHTHQSGNEILPVKIHVHKDIFLVVEYRKVFVKGQEVELARADFDMLELLMSQIGRVFTFEQIYYHAYGDNTSIESMTNSVHYHIKQIRKKILIDAQAKYIDSVRGIGYRMSI